MATQLDLADAQFIGWRYGKTSSDILSLVRDMGLTKKEWQNWLKKYPIKTLTQLEIDAIDKHFKQRR